MNETKNCPYCGEEILAGAKKCKHCGEWLEEEPKPRLESNKFDDVHFKTLEPKWWQKLLQMYWFNPKSWLLDELTILRMGRSSLLRLLISKLDFRKINTKGRKSILLTPRKRFISKRFLSCCLMMNGKDYLMSLNLLRM